MTTVDTMTVPLSEVFFPSVVVCNINQVRKSFFEELGIYDNETFIRQIYYDYIEGKSSNTLHDPHSSNVSFTVWLEGFLYKVALPELKISPTMYFVIGNSVGVSKILKIVVPFWLLFVYVNYYQNNQFYRVKNQIFKILLLWHNNFQYFGKHHWIVDDKMHDWWIF